MSIGECCECGARQEIECVHCGTSQSIKDNLEEAKKYMTYAHEDVKFYEDYNNALSHISQSIEVINSILDE